MARLKRVSDQDIDDLLDGNDSKSTQNTVKRSVNTFRTFLDENGYPTDFENLQTRDLNDRLRLFFPSIRKQSKNVRETLL